MACFSSVSHLKWGVSCVAEMSEMFTRAESFNADMSKCDVSRVTATSQMFRRVKLFKCDISKLDVSTVTNMDKMFFDAGRFNQQLCGVDCV